MKLEVCLEILSGTSREGGEGEDFRRLRCDSYNARMHAHTRLWAMVAGVRSLFKAIYLLGIFLKSGIFS